MCTLNRIWRFIGLGERWYKRKEELRMTFISDKRWSEETGVIMTEVVRIGQRQTEYDEY